MDPPLLPDPQMTEPLVKSLPATSLTDREPDPPVETVPDPPIPHEVIHVSGFKPRSLEPLVPSAPSLTSAPGVSSSCTLSPSGSAEPKHLASVLFHSGLSSCQLFQHRQNSVAESAWVAGRGFSKPEIFPNGCSE